MKYKHFKRFITRVKPGDEVEQMKGWWVPYHPSVYGTVNVSNLRRPLAR